MVFSKFELSGTLDEIEECIVLVFWLCKFDSWFVCCQRQRSDWYGKISFTPRLLLLLNFNIYSATTFSTSVYSKLSMWTLNGSGHLLPLSSGKYPDDPSFTFIGAKVKLGARGKKCWGRSKVLGTIKLLQAVWEVSCCEHYKCSTSTISI